ncbi:luciferin 4-monooxygenase-like [Ischnura elegans]|uniref:luciferin 4-monooxygenase-like n=1 Tax=Ischnura elegans TaxID=197161 RepID=UPI001ED89BDD|nr:luciferin 4-monooxygenase-like [Ischnura elegans]XP_046394808.1 luciferin 4-monooxygenase-like [Ischnura elegans]
MGFPDDDKIFRSPFAEIGKEIVIPDVSLPTFLFQSIRLNSDIHGDRPIVIDALRNQAVYFKEFEPLSKQFASALTRIGFKKGDVLFYLTYNSSLMYLLHVGVWLCGGATRGYYQREEKEELERIIKEVGARFVLCEPETSDAVKWAASQMEWPVKVLSIDGEVEGAIPVEDMVYKDDGSAYSEVNINPREDGVYIPSTNGSTGKPKGSVVTHFNIVSLLAGMGAPMKLTSNMMPKTYFSVLTNYTGAPFLAYITAIVKNYTIVTLSKFNGSDFFKYVDKYRPDGLFLFPYVANWFSRSEELQKHDLSSIREIIATGSVFDHATLSLLSKKMPLTDVNVLYGSTEMQFVSSQNFAQHYEIENASRGINKGYCVAELNNETHVSCGLLMTFMEAKILDVESDKPLGIMEKGKLLVRAPYIFKGYIQGPGKDLNIAVDENGWFDSGDLAFFDEGGHLFIVDRLKSIFKYYMHHVSPAEIEAVVSQIPAVLSVAVVGVPNPETTSEARAYVVVRPGCNVTEGEIKDYVAAHTPVYKHLHGGVVFLDKLPETRAGKIDRLSLAKKAKDTVKS